MSYTTAAKLIAIYVELGEENEHVFIFEHNFSVIARVSSTTEEDIHAALPRYFLIRCTAMLANIVRLLKAAHLRSF
jgi:hypothetical protein